MRVGKLATCITLLVFVSGVPVFHAQRRTPVTFTLTAPGVAFESGKILIAASLNNNSSKPIYALTVDSAQFDSMEAIARASISSENMGSDGYVTVQADFKDRQVVVGGQYTLAITGTYQTSPRGLRLKFAVRTPVIVPPRGDGSRRLRKVTVGPHRVKGGKYPPQPHKPDDMDEVNGRRWTIPTGKPVPGTPTKNETRVRQASKDGSMLLNTGARIQNVKFPADPVIFLQNNSMNLTGASTIAEPSGGSNGNGVVFTTSNWLAAYSNDGGNSFTQVNPTTVFPADAVGYCCDQVVQYVPSIDRFIWFLQGNGYRLAMARPSDIISSGATAWTYWNLTPQVFGHPAGTGLDYPDLSVGNNSLYASWDVGFPACPGCRAGFQVARISLAQIQAGGTITVEFTDPPDAPMAWGGHLMQNTLNEIFWAGHNSNTQMRVFSLAEGSGTYFWRDVGVASWANNALSSTVPGGLNWLGGSGGFPGSAIIGSTRVGNQLWFGWNAGTDRNFRQAHIEMVTLDRANNFNRTQQVQIWNPDYAFAYPSMATNTCTREVGLSFEFGGGGNFENHVVGFWGDFIAYITTGTDVGTTRFGDYVAIRQEPPTAKNRGNLFNAYGYGLNTVSRSTNSDIHYVLFGRSDSRCRGT